MKPVHYVRVATARTGRPISSARAEEIVEFIRDLHDLARENEFVRENELWTSVRIDEKRFLNVHARRNLNKWSERRFGSEADFHEFECWLVTPPNPTVQSKIASIFETSHRAMLHPNTSREDKAQCRREMLVASDIQHEFGPNAGGCTADDWVAFMFNRAIDYEISVMRRYAEDYDEKLAWMMLFPKLYEVLQSARCGRAA